jgi:hypothetical protein
LKTFAQKDICPEDVCPEGHLPGRMFAQKEICPEYISPEGHWHRKGIGPERHLPRKTFANVFWANVFLGKCLSGQMTYGQISFGTNVFLGKCLLGKFLMGKCRSRQMSLVNCLWANVVWANVVLQYLQDFGSFNLQSFIYRIKKAEVSKLYVKVLRTIPEFFMICSKIREQLCRTFPNGASGKYYGNSLNLKRESSQYNVKCHNRNK